MLSLEVPLIAALWQQLAGRTLGAELSWAHGALLAAAVWLIYSADRWLDGLELAASAQTQRHRFYAQHRRRVVWLWLGVAAVTLTGSMLLLTGTQLLAGSLLAAALLGYFGARHLGDRTRHPKELQIAVIFALGVAFLPLLSGASLLPLGAFTVCFAALIFLNCACIAEWEGDLDLEPAPFAARAPHVATKLPALALGLALVSGLGVALLHSSAPLWWALSGSAALLYLLGLLSPQLSPAARRVAADAALLTPLLALLPSLLLAHG